MTNSFPLQCRLTKTNHNKLYEMESNITFDQMPSIIMALVDKVDELSRKLDNITLFQGVTSEREEWFDVNSLSEYLPSHPATQTIYCWTHDHLIPYRKNGRRLVFLKSEIDEWIIKDKVNPYSSQDAMEEACRYIATHQRR